MAASPWLWELQCFPNTLINSDCVLQPHAGDRCEKSFPPAPSLCLLFHPASRARGGRVSNHGSPSTEQFPRAAKDPSLLFLFQSRFQSWLMFAQKYVIADFLLINPSSTQTTSLARCYYPSAWGESRVCPPGHGVDSQAPARRSV